MLHVQYTHRIMCVIGVPGTAFNSFAEISALRPLLGHGGEIKIQRSHADARMSKIVLRQSTNQHLGFQGRKEQQLC